MQMTEPGREKAIANELTEHPLDKLYDINRKKINFKLKQQTPSLKGFVAF